MENDTLKLKLNEDWYLNDLKTLLDIIDNLFTSFYAINELSNEYKNEINENKRELRNQFEEYRYFFEKYIRRRFKDRDYEDIDELFFHRFPFIHGKFQYTTRSTFGLKYRGISSSIINKDWYIKPADKLKIRKIHISSPGEIQIDGGGIIKEIRELIKDISYRNALEKKHENIKIENSELDNELKRLCIVEKKIQIMKDMGIPQDDIAKLSKYLFQNKNELEGFIEKKNIGLLIDEKG